MLKIFIGKRSRTELHCWTFLPCRRTLCWWALCNIWRPMWFSQTPATSTFCSAWYVLWIIELIIGFTTFADWTNGTVVLWILILRLRSVFTMATYHRVDEDLLVCTPHGSVQGALPGDEFNTTCIPRRHPSALDAGTHLVTHLVWPHGGRISMRPRALRTIQDP